MRTFLEYTPARIMRALSDDLPHPEEEEGRLREFT